MPTIWLKRAQTSGGDTFFSICDFDSPLFSSLIWLRFVISIGHASARNGFVFALLNGSPDHRRKSAEGFDSDSGNTKRL
jgi:hypothetical protein